MAITHKGIARILKHHALSATENSDDDIKNCIDAAIKNSDSADDDEMGDESIENSDDGDDEEEPVTNRDKEALSALQKQVETLTKKLNAADEPIHNRRKAGQPDVDINALESTEDEGQVIANRAAEIGKLNPNMTLAQTFIAAGKELDSKKKPSKK
jgi:hypothetical protein